MQANRFLREEYIGEFNRRFAVEPHEPGESAFVACIREDLDRVFFDSNRANRKSR